MSLADIYEKSYGETAETEKVASEIEKKLEGFSDVEVARLQAAGGLLDTYGLEFEDGHAKLAASGELLDAIEADEGQAAGGETETKTEVETDADDENVVQDDEGNVFRFLGNVNDVEPTDEDEKTAAEHEAAGRIMARAFSAELEKLKK